MIRKRIAIVSSYKIYCGIAYAAEQLEIGLKKFYDIDIIPVDHDFTHWVAPATSVRAGLRFAKDIASKVRDYEYVNMQLEPGLFGRHPFFMWRRICPILEAVRGKLIITLHYAELPAPITLRNIFASIRQYNVFGPFVFFYQRYWCSKFWSIIRRMMAEKRLTMLILNNSERLRFKHAAQLTRVLTHPLCYMDEKEREHFRNLRKPDFRQLFRYEANDVMLGVFGMVTPTKGTVDAIRALAHLPKHFKLAIFGGTNIRIQPHFEECSPYLQTMIQLVKALKLEDRVTFYGTTTNDEMAQAVAQVDIVILPYPETYQMASGPGSLAIELAPKIIATDTFAFNCYDDYFPGRMRKYDSGNYMQLAQMITDLQAEPMPKTVPYPAFNADTQAEFYRDIWEGTIDPECA
ncbi:MAG: glycosyltransferase [Alphaproteobacteria bacterium]